MPKPSHDLLETAKDELCERLSHYGSFNGVGTDVQIKGQKRIVIYVNDEGSPEDLKALIGQIPESVRGIPVVRKNIGKIELQATLG